MINATDITKNFGRSANSPEIMAIFEQLNTLRRPSLDEEDERSHHDWLLVRKKGVELGFVDSCYFNASPEEQWRQGEMILCQVYFYAAFDNVSDFTGALPYGLTFADDRDAARKTMQYYESVRRTWLTDCWTLPEFILSVRYDAETGLIDCVICRTPALPLPPAYTAQCNDADSLVSMLACAIDSEEVTSVFDAEIIEQQLDDDEVDMTYVYGADLGLADDEDGNQIVRSITLYANRFYDSPGWTGPLPMDLSFDDSPLTLREKIGTDPVRESDSVTTGYGLWELPDYTLHVMYSNVDNCLLKITMLANGISVCDEDDEDEEEDEDGNDD